MLWLAGVLYCLRLGPGQGSDVMSIQHSGHSDPTNNIQTKYQMQFLLLLCGKSPLVMLTLPRDGYLCTKVSIKKQIWA